jgi:RHS repeat-associated protein
MEDYTTAWDYEEVTFTYNAEGVRTKKTYFSDTSQEITQNEYILDGDRVLREIRNYSYMGYPNENTETTITYYYNLAGEVIGLRYLDADYYYAKNMQGDILEIYDMNGNLCVTYAYDAWGNILSIGGSMKYSLGRDNPFRYRSYYYDVETGLFYVGSRYYDPEIGRFINADVPEMMLLSDNIIGTNLFAYCYNNPVNYADPTGHAGFSITKAVNLLAPAMILTMFMAALNANYASGLVAVGGYITKIISLPVIKSFWWKPWLAGAIILGAVAIVTTTVIILYNAHVAKINKNNMNKKVKDILKTKLGSIKNAKLPPGSPSWNDIMELTLAEIYRRAQRGDTGFDTFKKLLTQGCYNK